ncbi:MAG: hypothetical protein WCK70_15210 [Chloroflexales bacterium]
MPDSSGLHGDILPCVVSTRPSPRRAVRSCLTAHYATVDDLPLHLTSPARAGDRLPSISR